MTRKLNIIGGGLAGSEAAFQAAKLGISVTIHEMRPLKKTDAHITDNLAELVCSNSFRSDDKETAIGLLHEEMRIAGSLIINSGDKNRIPAGAALAVDRVGFSQTIQKTLEEHPLIEIKRGEVAEIPEGPVIIATGPLTSSGLTEEIIKITGEKNLAFFDAIAPIIYKESLDFDKVWFQSRYDKGNGKDYINCPLSEEEYKNFIEALLAGEKTDFKEWEKNTPYFDGCLPIEVMAERGFNTLRFGPMKPVGLTNPKTGKRAYAVVQLRQDNKLGTLYNIVGFQTKLKYGEQQRIFKTIQGLENAEFARLGGLHRNTFINSPKLLDGLLRLKARPNVRFAGQITGVEGYVESAAIGFLAGRFAAEEILGIKSELPPPTTAFGALLSHITLNAESETFQPMNVNYGLFPELESRTRKDQRKKAFSDRALRDFTSWVNTQKKAA